MNSKYLIYILFFFLEFSICGLAYGQTGKGELRAHQKAEQQARDAQKQAIIAAQKERQRQLDSMKIARQHQVDSAKASRKVFSDSIAAIRKYRESKHFKDSVTKERTARVASIQAQRKSALDSIKAIRKHALDSAIASRKAILDQIRSVQKHRSDSLAKIRKYREGRRFSDSVAVVKKMRSDSIATVRKAFQKQQLASRKHFSDSLKLARKHVTDSMTAVRKQFSDKLKASRKAKTDSLAKAKDKRKKEQENVAKTKEQKMQLALELKIKKKHMAWSNEKMLKKKWGVPRQAVQNTFTRYNYFFNADKKMDEALANMQRVRKENYDSTIALFPFDPDRDSSVLAADMDSIIQKASVGIQIHDPRTKWGDDLYLLLGEAYYYKGHYNDAATSFRYILSLKDKNKKKVAAEQRKARAKGTSKAPSIAEADDKKMLDFLKHRSVHNESILWLARTYTQSKQEGNAESVLDLLDNDPNFPEELKGRLALEKAFIYLNQNDHKAAASQLSIVAADKNMPQWQRMRAAYLNGQLLEEQHDYKGSAASFRQVIAMTPKLDMDFHARKNIAYSAILAGENQDQALASLKRILNDAKYNTYYEQVYYVMGGLAASNGKNEDAITYLNKGIHVPKTTKKQKALSFAVLGNVYYRTGDYLSAKNAYDSASILGKGVRDTVIDLAMHRSATLGSITKAAKQIHDEDSLLALSMMNEKDQRTVIRKYIRTLEKMKSDSVFRAENAGINAAMQASNDVDDVGSAGRWYFNNPQLMQQGINDFKRKWGNRTLTDNWRRSAASSFANTGNAANNTAAADTSNVALIEYDENGLPTEASLLALIPNTPDEKNTLRDNIQQSYIDLANAYVREVEDYPPALRTIDTLYARYPNSAYRDEATYIRYIVALKQNNLAQAQQYSAQLQQQYPDSKFAALVKPTEDGAGIVQNDQSAGAYYDETYNLLLQHQFTNVLARVRDAERMYPNSKFKDRYTIVEGIALAGAGNYNKADTLLTNFVTAHPTDSLRAWADAALQYVHKNKPVVDTTGKALVAAKIPTVPVQPTNNVPQANAPVIPPAPPPANVPTAYTYKPQDEHYIIMSFPAMEQRAMGAKAAINDFNTFKFSGQNLKTDINMLQQSQGIIVIQSFKGINQAKIYMNMLGATSQIFREYKPGEYQIFAISADNYRKMVADKDVRQYLSFYHANYK